MTTLSISSYIVSHDFSIMFLAYNRTESFTLGGEIQETNKEFGNNINQLMENDLFFNFMKPEDSIYESAKAIYFSLHVTNNEKDFENFKADEERIHVHITNIYMNNYSYDSFQIAEDYEFSADESNIIKIDNPSQKDKLIVSIYADKKEEAETLTIVVLY